MISFDALTGTLIAFADKVPLELFVLIGSFIEDIIAPIPAPVVLTTAGSIAFLEGTTLFYVFLLSIIGSMGKTLGGIVFYLIGDKGEDMVTRRFGTTLNVSHEEVERLGRYFNGSRKDLLILILLRSIPIIPSLAISLGAGIIKLRLRTFILGSFLGLIVRGFLFLYVGYAGIEGLQMLASQAGALESALQLLSVVVVIVLLYILYQARHKHRVHTWLSRRIQGK
jgi:membrane protein DedA with SNARE-associated domain